MTTGTSADKMKLVKSVAFAWYVSESTMPRRSARTAKRILFLDARRQQRERFSKNSFVRVRTIERVLCCYVACMPAEIWFFQVGHGQIHFVRMRLGPRPILVTLTLSVKPIAGSR
jgi:hypothetical protein